MVWNARFLVKLTVALLALPAAAGESESPGWAAAAERHVARSGFLAGHLLRSHSHALLLRPVTSLANLGYYTLSLTGGAARDVALDVLPRTRSAPPRAVRPEGAEARMDLAAWEERLDRLTGRRATSGSVRLLIDGDAFYARLESEIRRARSSIRFRTYIFDNDDVALEVAELLKARSRAVTVQVLLDGLGTWGGALAESESLPPGHRGPASMPAYLRRDSSIDVRVLANTWLMGDHTKTFIFDDRLAFLGGMNIGREYRHDWHDLMLELEGAVVGDLARDARRALAESRWGVFARLLPDSRPARPTPSAGAAVPLRLLYTRPGAPEIYRAQLEAVRRARSHIYVQNAYLGDDRIVHELIRARQRGVDVRVIVPERPDSALMNASNAVTLNALNDAGVRVYLYPGMSHVKAAIYDGWVCLGTANFDRLSLRVNKEVNVASSDPALVEAVRARVFEQDFAVSDELLGRRDVGAMEHVYERVVDLLL